jgi:CheY-like chemotaxis protein
MGEIEFGWHDAGQSHIIFGYRHNLMKILIVDDSRMMQAGMKRALVNSGHKVILAGDGKGGLVAARQNLPDIILLDMMLPAMSGTEVLSALKEDPSTKARLEAACRNCGTIEARRKR